MSSPTPTLDTDSIEEEINTALKQILTQELIVLYPLSDPLRLRTLKLAPLQDDPTQVAPYFIYRPDPNGGRQQARDPQLFGETYLVEIGGDQLWETHYMGVAGSPRQQTRENASAYINRLARRIENVIMRHYELNDILAPGHLQTSDGREYVSEVSPLSFWKGTHPRTYGGDNEFYGECLFAWKYNFRRVSPWL